MKKALSMILALAMCLSLCACGSDKEVPVSEAEVVEDTIAVGETELVSIETEPVIVETEPRFETVELTLDNWQDYFELKEAADWRLNAFGEVDELVVGIYLQLKDDLQDRLYAVENGAVEYAYDFSVIGCDVNMEEQTYVLTETYYIYEEDHRVSTMAAITGNPITIGGNSYVEDFGNNWGRWNNCIGWFPANIEISRIQGTLSFYAE